MLVGSFGSLAWLCGLAPPFFDEMWGGDVVVGLGIINIIILNSSSQASTTAAVSTAAATSPASASAPNELASTLFLPLTQLVNSILHLPPSPLPLHFNSGHKRQKTCLFRVSRSSENLKLTFADCITDASETFNTSTCTTVH